MAKKNEVYGFDEWIHYLDTIGSQALVIAEKAVYEGTKIVADQVRANLKGALSGKSSGDLERALGVTPIENQGGVVNARVGFDGYDSRGVPNQLKANVLEYGSSKQRARPFVNPAVRKTRRAARKKMSEVFDDEINKL